MIDTASGLPLSVDEETGVLSFHDGLLCDGFSEKHLGQMEGLFASIEGEDPDTLVYRAYRNVRFAQDDELWLPRDMRYDITVIQPGTSCGEYFKTSGHYHGMPELKAYPYPELYEVVKGTVAFVLQNDEQLGADPDALLDDVRVVIVHEGESVVIPPFAGHGSINVADEVSAFSNIAVVSCPVLYDAVQAHHGLATRVMRGADGPELVANDTYQLAGEPFFARPLAAPDLGVTFGVPCYGRYVANPETYRWLSHVEEHMSVVPYLTK